MIASTKSKALALSAVISGLLVAYAVAQQGQPGYTTQPGQPGVAQPGQPGQPPTQPPTSSAQSTQRIRTTESRDMRNASLHPEVEKYVAECLLEKNECEVEISQFALQRSQNPEVKQFAQMLISDHQAAIQKLQRLTNTPAGTNRSQGVQQTSYEGQISTSQQPTGQQVTGQQPTGTTTVRAQTDRMRAGDGGGEIQQLAALEKRIGERAKQSLREKLEAKQGAEFDQCFVGSQIASHMHMLAGLEVLAESNAGELSQYAQESQPKVKSHLEAAEKLAEQLQNAAVRQSSNQPATQRVPR
jgi:putative membrane protein